MQPRYVVEYDKTRHKWVVTSVVENYGKVFKNFVGEADTKHQAEAMKAQAEGR